MLELCDHSQPDPAATRRADAIYEEGQPNALEQLAKLAPRTRLSPGYAERAVYLIWLEQMLNAGVEFTEPLTVEEAEGLIAIARGREQWNADNPPCGDCGARLRKGTAHNCKQKFMRERMGR